MFDPEQIPTMDTIAELFGIAPLALIVLAAFAVAFAEWAKAKLKVEGWKTAACSLVFCIGMAMLLPGFAIVDKLRVGVMAAITAELGWQALSGIAGKFAKKSEEVKSGN